MSKQSGRKEEIGRVIASLLVTYFNPGFCFLFGFYLFPLLTAFVVLYRQLTRFVRQGYIAVGSILKSWGNACVCGSNCFEFAFGCFPSYLVLVIANVGHTL